MKVFENKIDTVSTSDSHGVIRMIVENLCGAKYSNLFTDKGREWVHSTFNSLGIKKAIYQKKLSTYNKDKLGSLLFNAFFQTESNLLAPFLKTLTKLDMAQLNEILLLLDQDRFNEGFFEYFFLGKIGKRNSSGREISFKQLKEGIKIFRATAMLCFGNIRYAYKDLRKKGYAEIQKCIEERCNLPAISGEMLSRPKTRVLNVNPIKKDQTWYVGYLSSKILGKEKGQAPQTQKNIQTFYNDMLAQYEKTNEQAEKNTEAYLSWDYMDVYIATSMRQRWEFEDTFDFVKNLFKHNRLRSLNLRYFDPTQSGTGKRRIDKGLVEGLMLKRAFCTIYLAQESDTMGKDSELAATLAQGKPVIAFVPKIKLSEFEIRIRKRPLEYFKIRYRMLQAEGLFDDENFYKHCKNRKLNSKKIEKEIGDFVKKVIKHREVNELSLWHEDKADKQFKLNSINKFKKICNLISFAESFYFDKRFKTIAEIHPLSLQVHLDTGVTNGVLVVREIDECAKLLRSIITGKMSFSIEREPNERATLLKEVISGCPFRAVTEAEQLTNSFWNYYPEK